MGERLPVATYWCRLRRSDNTDEFEGVTEARIIFEWLYAEGISAIRIITSGVAPRVIPHRRLCALLR